MLRTFFCWISGFFKKISKTKGGQAVVAFCAASYVRFVYATTRWSIEGEQYPQAYWNFNKPVIICFWHGRLLMVCKAWRGPHPFHMLISGHSDGEMIAQTVQHFGIKRLKGSSSKTPKEAFKKLIQTLKAGYTVGITPDGPRGPCYSISPGIGRLAYLTGCDVIPLTFSTSRRKILGSWDRFFLALPFGRGVFIWGNPLSPKKIPDEATFLQAIQTSLLEITKQADDFFL
ncbi:MAG: lysophospholipid acyltransferase family protein [Alphaproteobacteria bacterium]